MTAIDPRPPGRQVSSGFLIAMILVTLVVSAVLQEARWRGAFNGLFASPLESPGQQIALAETAFRHGNNAVAVNLFEHLATQNNPVAESWLAHMTELGLGVPRDIPKAISLYEKAAAQGFSPAQAALGKIYLEGNAVLPDYPKALGLLEKAARQGEARAAMLLGQAYRLGLGTSADPVESYAWSEVAVLEGSSFARAEPPSLRWLPPIATKPWPAPPSS
jgi:TPR repeat protein